MPALLTGMFCVFAYFLETTATATVISSYFIFVFIYVFAESIFRGKVAGELLAATLKLTGILTIGWVLGYHLILLRNAEPIGASLIYLLAGTIWCSDTGAYLVGRAFGRHKLGTPVSPRKTIEGTIGGLVIGTLTSVALRTLLLTETLSWGDAIFIGLLLSVLGQLGDLSASLMKRTAGVKDSGQVIPGHGGFIDRCDSLIFSTPVLYYYLELTGHFG